jgi:adenine-specific DNA-methyltransferase
MPSPTRWTATSPSDWAKALGLVAVPLFDPTRTSRESGAHTVLLDGERSSFALSVCDPSDSSLTKDKLLSWCWSANLTFNLVVPPDSWKVAIQRWDAREPVRHFAITDEHGARSLFARMSAPVKSPSPSAVQRLIRLFRSLRRALLPEVSQSEVVVRVFNALLLGADAVRKNVIADTEFRGCRSLGDLFELLSSKQVLSSNTTIAVSGQGMRISEFAEVFLERDPATGCHLDTNLLLRHASGELYQEAHIELEKPASFQGTFFGIPSDSPQAGKVQPDARFTAPALARLMAEFALRAHREACGKENGDAVTVLDPACGAGVFLVEAWRDLIACGHVGPIRLIGYDNSPTACEMARFGLEHSVDQSNAQVNVDRRDSLSQNQWDDADVVLMNPPFTSWNDMDSSERVVVQDILGELYHDHADKSLAFIQAAVASLKPGSALGCVVPAPLLESKAGLKWRQSIVDSNDLSLCLCGCFRGFRYFRGATVEPAFLVIVRQREAAKTQANAVQVLLANEGSEDDAIRQVRRDPSGSDGDSRDWSVFLASQSDFSAASWLPRSREATSRLASLTAKRFPTVTDLFRVNLGIRTGWNKAFILRRQQLDQLHLNESQARWFRPAAGNATIRSGKLLETHFVFYPYLPDGTCAFRDENSIRDALPSYFEQFLWPNKSRLDEERLSKRDRDWWELSEPRVTWQATLGQKIVTSYFGQRGSFAFDEYARFAVVQGFGWTWRDTTPMPAATPWAYVAVLNSRVFSGLLANFCPTVRGGQYDLSVRFVKNVPLPNLASDDFTAHAIGELAEHGRLISTGEFPPLEILDRATCRVYGLVYDEWMVHEA